MSLPAENHASPSPSFKCFTGVDIAAKDFTADTLSPAGKPGLEKKPFEQTTQGFSHFLTRLAAAASGVAPKEHLSLTFALKEVEKSFCKPIALWLLGRR